MTADKMTDFEFACKIEDEGMLYALIDYGLRSSDLTNPHSELGRAWAALEGAELSGLVDRVQTAVEAALGAEGVE